MRFTRQAVSLLISLCLISSRCYFSLALKFFRYSFHDGLHDVLTQLSIVFFILTAVSLKGVSFRTRQNIIYQDKEHHMPHPSTSNSVSLLDSE